MNMRQLRYAEYKSRLRHTAMAHMGFEFLLK